MISAPAKQNFKQEGVIQQINMLFHQQKIKQPYSSKFADIINGINYLIELATEDEKRGISFDEKEEKIPETKKRQEGNITTFYTKKEDEKEASKEIEISITNPQILEIAQITRQYLNGEIDTSTGDHFASMRASKLYGFLRKEIKKEEVDEIWQHYSF